MNNYGYIYLTTNLVNGKKYVGQHVCRQFDTGYKGSGAILKQAFEKYGWDNFKCDVVKWCENQTELNICEQEYIWLYNTLTPQGYNLMTGGGQGGKHNEETKKKCSEAMKGKTPWNKGKHYTEESRKKISEARKGKHHTEETRNKMSEALKGKHHTEETRKKISESLLNSPKSQKRRKKVSQFTKDGLFVKEWASLHEIERVLGYACQHISDCCLGKTKYAYNYIWRYSETTL